MTTMTQVYQSLERIYGSHSAAADALGMGPRKFRKIRGGQEQLQPWKRRYLELAAAVGRDVRDIISEQDCESGRVVFGEKSSGNATARAQSPNESVMGR